MKSSILILALSTFAATVQAQDAPAVTSYLSSTRFGSGTPSSSLSEITAGQPIYGLLLTSESIDQITGYSSCTLTERVYVDDQIEAEYAYGASFSDLAALGSRYEIDIAPALDDILYPTQGTTLSKPLAALESGTHRIRVVVSYQQNGMSMSNTLGKLEFVYSAANAEGVARMKAMHSKCRSMSLAKVHLPEAGMHNASLEEGIRKAVEEAGWNQEVLEVILMDYDWQYMYHSVWATVTDRYLNVAVAVKDHEGNCILFFPVALQAKGEGDSYSSTFRLGGMHKLEQYIDCNNVH